MRAVHLLSGTALVMVLAGCSSGTTEAKPRASPSTQTARTGCYDEDDDLAQVTGDSGTHLALFYGGTLDLAPGTTGRGSEDYDLVGQVHATVRVTDPAGARLDPAQRREVTRMLPGFFNPLPPTHRIRRNAGNTTNRQQQWAVYGVARVRRGTWSREVCVDPAKGHTGLEPWRGSFTSVGRVRAGIKPCDEVRGSTSELNRALRELCPHGG